MLEFTNKELENIVVWLELHVPTVIKQTPEFRAIDKKIVYYLDSNTK